VSILEAIVLGIVQGLTEFLPISSTAHLRIIPALLGWQDPGAAYSAVIQLGTVVAVLVYFSKDIVRLTKAFLVGLRTKQPFGTEDSRLAWFVGTGTIPISVAGLLFKKAIKSELRSLYVIAGSLIVLALVLFIVERVASQKRTLAEMTLKDGIVVGLWQALALIPGSSRSGRRKRRRRSLWPWVKHARSTDTSITQVSIAEDVLVSSAGPRMGRNAHCSCTQRPLK
jgi:undecaprenyl-diphosphatase